MGVMNRPGVTRSVDKCPEWRRRVTDLLLSEEVRAGDTLLVQDHEMGVFARNLICRRALGVIVHVRTPPADVLMTWYGQDVEDFD